MARGLFIAFEGIDGCGKGTQAKMFHSSLWDMNKSNHVILTREPYNSEEIRDILRKEESAYKDAHKLADLFIKDREKHIDELVLPNIERGIHVVTDRYSLSTIAYQSAQGLDMDELIERHEGLLHPDITFLIDVPVYVAFQRSTKEEQKFEGDYEFQSSVHANYQEAARKLAKHHKIELIEGRGGIDKVADDVWNKFFFWYKRENN